MTYDKGIIDTLQALVTWLQKDKEILLEHESAAIGMKNWTMAARLANYIFYNELLTSKLSGVLEENGKTTD